MTSDETARRSDPLLTSARWLLWFLIALVTAGAVVVLLGVGGLLTAWRGEMLARIAAAGAPTSTAAVVILGFLALFVIMVLTALLLTELRKIVESVGENDPFRPENADRLQRMGWLALTTKFLWIGAVAVAHWVAKHIEPTRSLPEYNLFSGILLIVILFILARVFRVGAAMRDDLEGTV